MKENEYERHIKKNKRRTKFLGMNHSTASNRLRVLVMFDLVQRLGKDTCYRCHRKIERVEDFSIDHIEPWMDVSPELFWDMDNITFSHKGCNYACFRNNRDRRGRMLRAVP